MGFCKRLGAAWQILKGKGYSDLTEELERKGRGVADLAAELERLRLDFIDRDNEIKKLRQEYALREGQASAEVAKAGSEALFSIGRRVGPLLSQLATTESLAGQGRGRKL